jgi:NAD(P)-dependent dehydrogenase (short-subunit alcohol dehydrogenase family)
MVPLGRMGIPEEIEDLELSLVSDQSRYITGECFNIAGGFINKRSSYERDQYFSQKYR